MENVSNPGVEKGSATLSACSACAGDYEDPDWTAPHDDGADELARHEDEAAEDRHGGPAGAEGFLSGDGMPQE